MKVLKKRLGEKIRARRIKMGFDSQESFAAALGLRHSSIQRWESGQYAPKDENIPDLCRVLQVTEDFFSDGEIEPSAESIFEYVKALETDVLNLRKQQNLTFDEARFLRAYRQSESPFREYAFAFLTRSRKDLAEAKRVFSKTLSQSPQGGDRLRSFLAQMLNKEEKE